MPVETVPTERKAPLARRLLLLICVAAVAAVFVGFALDFYLWGTAPTHPVPGLGKIYPIVNDGYVTYVTQGERLCSQAMPQIGVAVGLLSGFLLAYLEGQLPWQIARRRPQLRHPK